LERLYCVNNFPLDENTLKLQETLFHNANGYLGVRGTLEEGVPQGFDTMRGTYLNGFYEVIPMKQSESLCNLTEEKDTMLNVADTQSIGIFLEGEEFSMFTGELLSVSRTLDMSSGTTERRVRWRSPEGREASLRFVRMASFVQKNVFTIECEIIPENFSGTVKVVSLHKGLVCNYSNPDDPRMGASSKVLLRRGEHSIRDGASYLSAHTERSGLQVCTGVRHDFPCPDRMSLSYAQDSHSFRCEYSQELSCGSALRFVKYTAAADSRHFEDPMAAAEDCMSRCFGKIESLYAEQLDYLKRFWYNADTEIDSDDDSSLAMAFNQYQLLQSCGDDGISGIASKGLSGEGYEGHCFWDTEIYVIPFFTCTEPELARKLLGYRYATLAQAKENARLLGHKKGALYPWRTISGRECSGYFPSGSAQYHINGDIAHAIIQYYLFTGDKDYLVREGAEILFETARLWLDAGNMKDGRFIINDVTGPDEYTCIVNNNFYTNACARDNMYWAAHIQDILTEAEWTAFAGHLGITDAETAELRFAADRIYLPYDETLGINPQDDSFLQKPVWDFKDTPKEHYPLLLHYHPLVLYRHQVCKQADTVLSYFLFDRVADKETMKRSFAYYESITTHDSSLSRCAFSLVAARLGMYGKAWEYFGESLRSDLVNSHGNTGDGIHTANMGGSYMALINGFGGVSVTEDGLSLCPEVPDAWRGCRFRLHYRGSFIEVCAERGECTVTLLEGKPLTLAVCGREVALSAENPMETVHGRAEPKAIIFDLDGVICSTDEYHYQAWKKLADELGIYFDREINQRLRGVSRMDSLEIVLERSEKSYSPEEKAELAAKKNASYVELLQGLTPEAVLPGMTEFLAACRVKRIPTALASASKNAPFIIQRLKLEDGFDYIADAARVKRSKPAPDIFLAAAEGLGIDPKYCIGIEDAEAGVEAIHAAGMMAVGIGDAVRQSGAELLVPNTYSLSLDSVIEAFANP